MMMNDLLVYTRESSLSLELATRMREVSPESRAQRIQR